MIESQFLFLVLKYNRNDADLIKGLQTLRQLNQRGMFLIFCILVQYILCRFVSFLTEIETESDSECEAADDDDSDFIIDSKGIHIDPRVANKTAPSANTPQSNDDKKTDINFKDKMYRAILIKLDEDESKKVA